MEHKVEVRPYGQKELATLYGVSDKTMRKWLRSIAGELGNYQALLLTIQQVETVFMLKGHPRVKPITNDMEKQQENVFWRQVLSASRNWNISEDVIQDAMLLYLEKGFPENGDTIPILYGIAWRMQRDDWQVEVKLKLTEQQYGYDHKPSAEDEMEHPETGQLLRVTGALLKQRYDYYINHSYLEFRSLKAKMDAMVKGLLQPNGYSIEDDLQPLTNRYMDELVKLREEIDHLESLIHFERVLAEVVEEKRKRSPESRDLNYRVAQFARLNSLLAEKKVYQTALPPLPAPNGDKLKAQAKAKALILIAKAKAA